MIPKIIHQIWLNETQPPQHFQDLAETWKQLNPHWEYLLWSEKLVLKLLMEEYINLLPLFLNGSNYAEKSDVARYAILHKFGGVYTDIDTECLASFDFLISDERIIISQEPTEHWPAAQICGLKQLIFNGTIASPANHPFWPHVFNVMALCKHSASTLERTGPLMLTGCIETYAKRHEIAVHSCHLFTPTAKDNTQSSAVESGHYAPKRCSIHHWSSTWFSVAKTTGFKKLRSLLLRFKHHILRGEFQTFDEAKSHINHELLKNSANTSYGSHLPNVAILIPLRDASLFLGRCIGLINQLDYPKEKIKIVFCEGDSKDNTVEQLKALIPHMSEQYRAIELLHFETGNTIKRKKRWRPKYQRQRRSNIAKVRNHLIEQGLDAQDQKVLWIDVDVIDYDTGILKELLNTKARIVVPNCVLMPGAKSFDLNSYLDIGANKDINYYRYLIGGIFQPPSNYYYHRHLHDMRYLDQVNLTGVGGTMLLVDANIHRAGIQFPAVPYKNLLETEGFGKMAVDFGITPVGLPNVEIIHDNS